MPYSFPKTMLFDDIARIAAGSLPRRQALSRIAALVAGTVFFGARSTSAEPADDCDDISCCSVQCPDGTCGAGWDCCCDPDGVFRGCCLGACCYDFGGNVTGCCTEGTACCGGLCCPDGTCCNTPDGDPFCCRPGQACCVSVCCDTGHDCIDGMCT